MGLDRLSAADLGEAGVPLRTRRHISVAPTWALACFLLIADALAAVLDRGQVKLSDLWILLYLAGLGAALTFASVHLPRGYLAMSGIASCAASLTLPPRLAVLAGLVAGLVGAVAVSRAPIPTRVAQAGAVGAWTGTASWIMRALVMVHSPKPLAFALTAMAWTGLNWGLTAVVGATSYRQAPTRILRLNINYEWLGAFIYIAISSVVLASVLDGSGDGFVLSTLVAVLSLALADSIAGRQLRARLQEQLSNADRYLIYSRVVEGTIHDARNFIAVGIGQLDEALASAETEQVALARSALRDAAESLNRLRAGSSPKVQWSDDPLELASLAADVVRMTAGAALAKRVQLSMHRPPGEAYVRGDSLLLRQVVTNLVLNAVDAVTTGGQIDVTISSRGDQVALSVADDGPGVPEQYLDRMFEPHFTTKTSGSGLGLFVSYGIVREHRGNLLYEGSKDGAVFTVLLPRA